MRLPGVAAALTLAVLLQSPALAQFRSTAPRSGATARAALNQATEAAKNWKADAVLTSVTTQTLNEDGRGLSWFYGFYSPKDNLYLNVTVRGRNVDVLEVRTGKQERVPSDFLDSNQALEAATNLGLKGNSPAMVLTGNSWFVTGGQEKGNVGIWLDARTGRLIKRQPAQ